MADEVIDLSEQTARPVRVSTYACKVTVAVTGLLMAAFVAVHMVGNLKAYQGAESYNSYSLWLRNALYPLLPHEGLLWIMRVVLLPALLLHVGAAVVLWWRARQHRGRHPRRSYRAWAARTMPWTGVLLLAFVVFHILDLTLGIAGPVTYQAATQTQSYAFQNTIASLSRPWAGGFYLVTMLGLAAHLWQGLWATTTDLGITGRRTRAVWLVLGRAVALVVALGNASLPLAIWSGVLA